MKDNLKNFLITFVLMMIFDLGYYSITGTPNFGGELNPHLGILFIAGLFFGPYGCLGAVVGNFLCDIVRYNSIALAITSGITSFIVSYFAYKLWYTKNSKRFPVTRPRLNNTYNTIYLLVIIIESGLLYSVFTTNLVGLIYPVEIGLDINIGLHYFVNFTNFGLIFTVIGIMISKFKDFIYIPSFSKKEYNKKEYTIIHALMIITIILCVISVYIQVNNETAIILTIILTILATLYVRKPITGIENVTYNSIPERIMNNFVIVTVVALIIDWMILFTQLGDVVFDLLFYISTNEQYIEILLIIDVLLMLLFLPSGLVLMYIENNVITPIKSFSQIESFIKKDKKIESKGILDIYKRYLKQDDEIGILSRSYTDLINYNNEYIENLKNLEAEKQRTNAELNIAHNIQKATLPKESINTEDIEINGYSKAAKEVGGDFYDYYQIDEENTMITIGDASGKGIPAAIITMLTQKAISLLIKNDLNPANVLCEVNNQVCENNTEMMFITLFLAIYNNKTHKLTYANAGHNPPIIKHDGKYKMIDIDPQIVLGVLEDYEYENQEIMVDEEIVLYTDGITDAQNSNKKLYGEDRLIDTLNKCESDDILTDLLNDINEFSKDEEQFDDMTLLILKVKD